MVNQRNLLDAYINVADLEESYSVYSSILNNTHRKCTSYTAKGAELHSFIYNGIISTILIFPGIILNSLVISKYKNFSLKDRHRNSNFLILIQAVGNLFNVLVTSPLMGIGYIVYYTNLIPTSPAAREATCPYWYMISQWAVVTSVTGRLVMFAFSALDRLYAVWKPVYWYNHLNGQYSACKRIVLSIWFISGIYSLGEVYGHGVEFFSPLGLADDAQRYHDVRAVVCCVLTILIVLIWAVTFYLTYHTLRQTPRIKTKSMAHTKDSATMQSTMSLDLDSICMSPMGTKKVSRPTLSSHPSRSTLDEPSEPTTARSSLEPPQSFIPGPGCESSFGRSSKTGSRDSGYASPAVICFRNRARQLAKYMNENRSSLSSTHDQKNFSINTLQVGADIDSRSSADQEIDPKSRYSTPNGDETTSTIRAVADLYLSQIDYAEDKLDTTSDEVTPENSNKIDPTNNRHNVDNRRNNDRSFEKVGNRSHLAKMSPHMPKNSSNEPENSSMVPKNSSIEATNSSIDNGSSSLENNSFGKNSDSTNKSKSIRENNDLLENDGKSLGDQNISPANNINSSISNKHSSLGNNIPTQLRLSVSVPLSIAPQKHIPITATLSEACSNPKETHRHHRPNIPARLRHFTPSCTVLAVVEWKLIRIFATMLSFFLIGYIPILFYLIACLAYPGVFQAHAQSVRIVYATGSTSGLVLASCLCPLLVLLSVKNFRIKGLRKRLNIGSH